MHFMLVDIEAFVPRYLRMLGFVVHLHVFQRRGRGVTQRAKHPVGKSQPIRGKGGFSVTFHTRPSLPARTQWGQRNVLGVARCPPSTICHPCLSATDVSRG
jgi:hypothetical protein